MFSLCILLLLHSSHVEIFSCCTLFMLHYFQSCSEDVQKHLRWRALQQWLRKPLNIVVKLSILDVLGVRRASTVSILHFFHFALFSSCTRHKTQPKNDLYTQHRELVFTFILKSYDTFLSLYSFERLIKWKETNLLFCNKRICLPRLETFKTRIWNLFLLDIKYLADIFRQGIFWKNLNLGQSF